MYDLCVNLKSSKEKDLKLAIKRVFELGWDCVAWTTSVNGRVTGNHIKPVRNVIMEPIQRRDALELRSLTNSKSTITDVRQLNRITITVDDMMDAQMLTLGNTTLNSFDIIAVRPGNIKVMTHLCKTADIDIITLDFTHRLPFSINKKLLDEAVMRGIHFEILYSPILGIASGVRQEIFSNTRVLIQYLRGRNILLSSGADNIGQFRGPMDVCNIGRALGLNDEQAMKAISNNCAMVMKHSIARKCRYLPLEVISKSDFESRYPEINLDDSQSSIRNFNAALSDSDEEDDDGDEDAIKAPIVSSTTSSSKRSQEGLVDLSEAVPASTTSLTDSSSTVFISQNNVSEMDYDAAIMEQEGIVENSVEESNSFALGDSFISFSDTPSSPLSNKRALTDVDKPASNKKITIDRDVTASHVKKLMNTPKSLKNKGKLSKRKG